MSVLSGNWVIWAWWPYSALYSEMARPSQGVEWSSVWEPTWSMTMLRGWRRGRWIRDLKGLLLTCLCKTRIRTIWSWEVLFWWPQSLSNPWPLDKTRQVSNFASLITGACRTWILSNFAGDNWTQVVESVRPCVCALLGNNRIVNWPSWTWSLDPF